MHTLRPETLDIVRRARDAQPRLPVLAETLASAVQSRLAKGYDRQALAQLVANWWPRQTIAQAYDEARHGARWWSVDTIDALALALETEPND